jgi:hypothetical protein
VELLVAPHARQLVMKLAQVIQPAQAIAIVCVAPSPAAPTPASPASTHRALLHLLLGLDDALGKELLLHVLGDHGKVHAKEREGREVWGKKRGGASGEVRERGRRGSKREGRDERGKRAAEKQEAYAQDIVGPLLEVLDGLRGVAALARAANVLLVHLSRLPVALNLHRLGVHIRKAGRDVVQLNQVPEEVLERAGACVGGGQRAVIEAGSKERSGGSVTKDREGMRENAAAGTPKNLPPPCQC